MDWLRQIPIGQFVDGRAGWLRVLDPRLKLGWVLMFLLTPVLAGPVWRVSLLGLLLLLTFCSGLPVRVWWRSLAFLALLAIGAGVLATLLPTGTAPALLSVRPPTELGSTVPATPSWELLYLGPFKLGGFSLGPLVVTQRSAQLGLNTSTLILTVVHSVNLMLLTTPSEDLVWALAWCLSPLGALSLPVDRLSFQLLLALRFLPLVQEELQNLVRSLASRAVNLKRLGLKASFGLVLAVGERLLANILLRAEQGAEALMARGSEWLPTEHFRPSSLDATGFKPLNLFGCALLLLMFGLRGRYGSV